MIQLMKPNAPGVVINILNFRANAVVLEIECNYIIVIVVYNSIVDI